MTGGLPTAHSALREGRTVEVHCYYCRRHRPIDLAALVAAGRGDVPLAHLRFRRGNYDGTRTGLIANTLAWQARDTIADLPMLVAAEILINVNSLVTAPCSA